ncbi:MAG: response regulator [Verrucomicrobiales bacterium]
MNSTDPVILLVEDAEADALFILNAFRKAHITNRIEVVNRAEDAMAYINGEGPYADRARYPNPIFLLLDLTLPGISGLSLLEWVRKDSLHPSLPIIVVSGSPSEETRLQCERLGANDYFAKALKMEDMPRLVKSVGGSWAFQISLLPDDIVRSQHS